MWKHLFLKSTFLKIKWSTVKDNDKGVTLIELLTAIAIIGLVSVVISSMFIFGIKSYNVAEQQIESYSSGRLAYLNLERQIKRSEIILIKDDIVYIQDLESPAKYYNYYILADSQIKKCKVDRDNLAHIPYGYKSQFAKNIADFELIKIKESKNIFRLKIVAEKEGSKLNLNSLIRVGVDVINK